MKCFIGVLALLFFSNVLFAQDVITELKNSVERADGGSGAAVEYQIYLTPANVKSFYAHEFDSCVLVEQDGKPVYLELIKEVGDTKSNVLINLESVSFIEMEIQIVKGKYKYQFKFYY